MTLTTPLELSINVLRVWASCTTRSLGLIMLSSCDVTIHWLGFQTIDNMVNDGKIADQTRALVCIAQK